MSFKYHRVYDTYHASQGAVEGHKETPLSIANSVPKVLQQMIHCIVCHNLNIDIFAVSHLGQEEHREATSGGTKDSVDNSQGHHTPVSLV